MLTIIYKHLFRDILFIFDDFIQEIRHIPLL